MIRINSNDQGRTAVFELALEDRGRAMLDVPSMVCLTIDEDGFTGSSVEAFASRWVVIASMLTGLTCEEVAAEGFEVRKLVNCTWVPRPPHTGTNPIGDTL